MPDKSILGIVAGIISFVAFVPYIVSILRGETKPNRASWLIWTVVGGMLVSSYYESGAGNAIWVPVSYVVGPLATFLISLRYNDGAEWSGLNKFCILVSAGSFVLWLTLPLVPGIGDVFNVTLAVMYINIFIDGLGALPTLVKSFHEPETEDRLTWGLFFAGNMINIFAVDSWSFATGSYPVYMAVVSGMITLLVISRIGPTVKRFGK